MHNPNVPSQTRQRFRTARGLFFVVLTIALFTLPSRADVIILKDGYAIHGKVIAEQSIIDDKGGQQFVVPKLKGLNMVDDGPRLTVFSPNYKRLGDVDPQNKFAPFQLYTQRVIKKTEYSAPPVIAVDGETPFNQRWLRTLTVRNFQVPNNPHKIEQQVDLITPHYLRLNSITHKWLSFYLTREQDPTLIRKLLSTHPDLIEKSSEPEVGKRAKLIRFLIQADWLNEAEEEIERLLKDLPKEDKKAEEFRDEIRLIRLDQLVADVEQAKESGQHDRARKLLAQFPKDGAPANLTLKVAKLRAEYDAATTKLDKARRLLGDLAKLADAAKFKDLIAAVGFIDEELHLDTASRLNEFLILAEQAEKARLANKPPLHEPEKLLSAAVCAWLMGNAATDTKLETARKRLKAREYALNYLREADPQKRRGKLLDHFQDTEALPFDELEKLISLLPPPEADKNLTDRPMDRKAGPLPGLAAGANYLLKVPPEYQHGRAYPLLIVLPSHGQSPKDALKGLGDLPAKFGHIVAVLDWGVGFKTTYTYTEEERAMVTGLVRHLRRTLQVDSDKVFLFGEGEGANYALDMGATHPDLFAGVIPMNAFPVPIFFRSFEYSKNFQNLPVYMVVGDRMGTEPSKLIHFILTEWMGRGYPSLAVSYKGRGPEFFAQEMPYIFDWMSRKTRPTAFPDLGRPSEEFRTVWPSSNHFYWISSEEIAPANLFDPDHPKRVVTPAKVQARCAENIISVDVMGMKQLSIWLGKGTVDFAKPVVVSLRGRGSAWKKELSPKIAVLLEDLYERGDRQRPFYQRIDCTNLNGVVKFSGQ